MSWHINFLLISIIILFPINCFNLNSLPIKSTKNDTFVEDILIELIKAVMNQLKGIKNLPGLSDNCSNILSRTFFVLDNPIHSKNEIQLALYYYTKFLVDSSTNVNDLSSYPNCINEKHNYDFSPYENKPLDPLYITIFIDHRKQQLELFRNNKTITSYLVGICFVDNCTRSDVGLLAQNVMNILNLTNPNETLEYFLLNENNQKPSSSNIFFRLIPLYIISLHIFIQIFHNFLTFIFFHLKKLCCTKKKRRKIIPLSGDEPEIEKVKTFPSHGSDNLPSIKHEQNFKNFLNALFNIETNFDFLFSSQSNSEINNNDSGLSYMNGIKAISMLTMIFGFTFIDLFNSPITKKSLDNFYEILSNPFFFIFYFGIKYAPKLLLCSSGFSLFFKFMCYLDNKTEIEEELKRVQEEEENLDNNNKINDYIKNNKNIENKDLKENKDESNYTSNDLEELSTPREKRNINLSVKYLFLFIVSQFNKYILYLLIIFFILYSLYDIARYFIGIGPLWFFFRMKVIKTSLDLVSLIPAVFCYQFNFFNKYDVDSLFTYYFLIYQEVIFFLISTFIIFIGYKFNLRIDRFILVTIAVCFVFRFFYYFLSDDLNVRDYFDFTNYAYFYNSPIYNYLYYAIGIYFGSLNYVIQKGYSYYECERQKKMYLLGITRLLKMLRNRSKVLFYYLGRVFLIIIFFFSFWQCILFEYVQYMYNLDGNNRNEYSSILSNYNKDILPTIIFLIDTDIVVLLVNFMTLFFYLTGASLLNDFLNLQFFKIFNKIHFSFLLLMNPVIFYVFYMTESRINFSMQNCYLYSFACGFLILILTTLLYGLFELPYKRVVKLILTKYDIKLGEKRLDNLEKKILLYKKEEENNDDSNVQENENESMDTDNKNLFNEDENLIKL